MGTTLNELIYTDLGVQYGGVAALSGINFGVKQRQVTGLIGPNGAGKTTLINATTGIIAPSTGSIRLGTIRIDGRPSHLVARAGIARTYQNIRLFAEFTVAENVAAGAYRRSPPDEATIRSLLTDAGIADLPLGARAGSLSYGDQRRLEIARAMASEPEVLLLDEPAAGMNPHETRALGALIRAIADGGTAVLLVEHDMPLIFATCDHVVVLNFGEVIAAGAPSVIARDPAVIEAYLGSAATP